jgi:hypothetical protein
MMHDLDLFMELIEDGTYLLVLVLAFTAFFKRKYVGKVYGLLIAAIIFDTMVTVFYFSMFPRLLGHTPEVKMLVGAYILTSIRIMFEELFAAFLVGVIYKKVRGEYTGRLLACLGIAAFFAIVSELFLSFGYSEEDNQKIHMVLDKYLQLCEQKNI